ncbi:O-antigen ligase family protein [Fangia hongkongensis]|uniref:O-antigen ligase family protein n=2 Tax=Fangia hongkongensis TaxID=270495 RepID=UPI000375A3EF|nr:O-antigen ligase family protein [Fangia hongkongensis]
MIISIIWFSYILGFWLFNFNELGVLYGIKYYYAQIFITYCTYLYVRKHLKQSIVIALTILVCILAFSIVQHILNYYDGIWGNPLNLYMYNLETRPAALFSETTWVGESSVLTIILLFYAKRTKLLINRAFMGGVFVSVCALFISNTRAAYIALLVILLMNFRFLNLKIVIKLSSVCLLFIVILSSFFFNEIESMLDWTIDKFHFQDLSAKGRWDAVKVTFLSLFENVRSFLVGHGFAWSNVDAIKVSGTAIGAKSFSILLFIPYVFGVVGMIVFLYLIIRVGLHARRQTNQVDRVYGMALLVAYLAISAVAPLFQYPLGIIWLAFSLAIIYSGQHKQSKPLSEGDASA